MGITMIAFPDRQKWIESLPDIRAQWKDDLAQKRPGQRGRGSHQFCGIEALKPRRKK
jgi:hypothetical protein